MWQSSFNKPLYGCAATNTIHPCSEADQQQDEAMANLMHLQKLHLTDLMAPITPAAHVYHAAINSANLIASSNVAAMPPSDASINHLQQYFRSHIGGGSNGSKSRSETVTKNHHLLLSSAADKCIPANFLPPPPAPLPPTLPTSALPASAVLDMSLEIFTEALLRLNRLPSQRLTQNLPQLLACNTTNSSASNVLLGGRGGTSPYFSGSGTTASTILPAAPPFPPPLPPSAAGVLLPTTTQLQSPQHLNLFKQYLTLEQHQLQQHLMALNANQTNTNTANNIVNTTTSPIANGYYSASMNFSHYPAPPPRSFTASSSSTVNCNQHRALRKRREDLKNLFKKPHHHHHNHHATKVSASVSVAVGLESAVKKTDDQVDDLLPPPKKKWIRHYLKGTVLMFYCVHIFFFFLKRKSVLKLNLKKNH